MNNGIFTQDIYGRSGWDGGLPRPLIGAPGSIPMPYHYPGGDWKVDLINNFVFVVDTRLSTVPRACCRTPGSALIDWGDGIIERRTDAFPVHTYSTHGIYIIQIIGSVGFSSFGIGTQSTGAAPYGENLIKCLSYGRYITNLLSGFRGCSNLIEIPKTLPSHIVRVWWMLSECPNFNQDISLYDFANLESAIDGAGVAGTSLQYLLNSSTKFNNGGVPLTFKSTNKISTIDSIFINCINFNQDVSSWDTSNITNMAQAFRGTTFNQTLNTWNTSNVTNMNFMFNNATNFNQPLNNWNVRKVTSFASMFQGATSFNGSLSGWALGADTAGTTCASMFQAASSFVGSGLSSWDVSKINNMTYMFYNASSFNTDIGGWSVGHITSFDRMFAGAQSFNNGGSSSIGGWNTGNVTNMSNMFLNNYNFNQPIGSWNVSKVTKMDLMLSGASSFQQDISGWNLAGLNAATALDNFMLNRNGVNSYSTANYDALLIGWNNNKLATSNGVANWRTDLRPNFGGAKYTAGGAAATARAALVSYGWTITDGGSI